MKSGSDGAFAMGLVLILDQTNGESYFDHKIKEPAVDHATEDPVHDRYGHSHQHRRGAPDS